MGNGTEVQTPPQNTILDGIYTTADNAQQAMQDKRAEYEAAMAQLSVFELTKYNTLARLKSAQFGGNSSLLKQTQAEYASVCNNYSDANINADVLRDSLMGSIFYAGKMNNCAMLANAVSC